MKFSITIPAYKAAYLKECIESILAQTYSDFELIIVNDASPEDLTSIVRTFNDSRIRYYVNEKNCGAINVVDNWNKCLSYATGDYVICMGDDDKLLPTCLEEYKKLIERHPDLGVYHAWTEIIDEKSDIVGMQETRPEFESVYSMMWGRWFGRIQFIGDFLFDRKRLIKNGGFYKLPLAWASDDITAYIAAQNNGIANMQVPGFQYRVNSLTISNNGNANIKLIAINLEEEWYEHFFLNNIQKLDDINIVFRRMLLKKRYNVINKKKVATIAQDLSVNGLHRIFFYYIKCKSYKLSFSLLAYSILEALKYKFKKY